MRVPDGHETAISHDVKNCGRVRSRIDGEDLCGVEVEDEVLVRVERSEGPGQISQRNSQRMDSSSADGRLAQRTEVSELSGVKARIELCPETWPTLLSM